MSNIRSEVNLEMVDCVGIGGEGGPWEGHTVNIADPVTFKSSLVG